MIDPEKTGLTSAQLTVQGKELVDLYLFLKKKERDLGASLPVVLRKIERLVYEHLSIDEIEKLHQL